MKGRKIFVPQEFQEAVRWRKYADPINQSLIKRRSRWYEKDQLKGSR
jgi:hypothetical protein